MEFFSRQHSLFLLGINFVNKVRLKAIIRLYKEEISRNINKGIQIVVDVVYDRIDNQLSDFIGFFLNILSLIFSEIIRLRYQLYRHKILKDNPLGCSVIVVGNITVGGTGKTPVVEKLAKTLQKKGRKVAIISRGYKSKKESLTKKFLRFLTHGEPQPPKIVSNGKELLLNSKLAGDEPYMLAKNLPGVVVICDKNRVKAGYYAIKNFMCDTLVLDDGLQYLKLKGTLNICLIDSTNPFGNEHLLPRGILREPLHRLSRADYIFITKVRRIDNCEELSKTIKQYNSKAPIVYSCHRPKFLINIENGNPESLELLKNQQVGLFSGIAYPESFVDTIKEQGAEIVFQKRFLDHHRFTKGEILSVYNSSYISGAKFILTTEKDAVRLPKVISKIPVLYLRLEIELLEYGTEIDCFNNLANRICLPKQK